MIELDTTQLSLLVNGKSPCCPRNTPPTYLETLNGKGYLVFLSEALHRFLEKITINARLIMWWQRNGAPHHNCQITIRARLVQAVTTVSTGRRNNPVTSYISHIEHVWNYVSGTAFRTKHPSRNSQGCVGPVTVQLYFQNNAYCDSAPNHSSRVVNC
ncbi:hypothetical protein ABEB36_000632 [Hypothenemus hampei]|uniref:Uncharacterized protein n=1 Tax=Hypothenemus hampei TaxID=57062 RepID=A0ABD1FEJ5_HYPHA